MNSLDTTANVPLTTVLMQKLPALLRMLGASILLIAMYSFLVKGWQDGNDITRYLLMLAHTGVLACIGLFSGHWLKESKGARLLLTLSLVSVTVNFSILGALIYSQTGALAEQYPGYVAWTSGSLQTALTTTAGSLLVLVPTTFLGFMVLARGMSRKLGMIFLLSNAALLLPLRDTGSIGLLLLALTFSALLLTRRISRKTVEAKTYNGMLALALQFMPIGVLFGRTLWLYSTDTFLLAVLMFTLFILLRQISRMLENKTGVYHFLNGLSLLPAALMTPLLIDSFDSIQMFNALIIPFAFSISAAMFYDVSRRKLAFAKPVRWISGIIMLFGMGLNMMLHDGFIVSFIAIVTGIFMTVMGYSEKQRSLFISGLVISILGLFGQLYDLFQHFTLESWAGLAVLGVSIIIVASAIDARGRQIQERLMKWKTSFKEWE